MYIKYIHMQMKMVLSFSFVLLIIILFSIDPDTSLVADIVYKLSHRDVVIYDDKANKDKDKDNNNNKAHNATVALATSFKL